MLSLLLAFLLAQDPQIGKLIEDLGSDTYAVRDEATKVLIKIGAPAVDALKAALRSNDPETSSRATAILAEIERNTKTAIAFKTRPTISVKKDGIEGKTLFEEFKIQTGVEIVAGNDILKHKFSVAWNGAFFLEVLDMIGQEVNSRWTWQDKDIIKFTGMPFIKRPTAYREGIKIFPYRIDSYRSWDGNDGHGLGWVYLAAETDYKVDCKQPTFHITEVSDGGTPIEIDKPEMQTKQQTLYDHQYLCGDPMTINKLNTTTKSVSIKGKLTFLLPVTTKEVELTDFQNPVKVGDIVVSPINVGSEPMTLLVTKPGEVNGTVDYIDFTSIEVYDADGTVIPAAYSHSTYAPDSNTIDITFGEGEHPPVKKIKFKLFTEFIIKEVPFNFSKVEFP